MLHIITESNKELKNRVFPLPDGVRKILQKTLEEYKGDKTIEGYKRLNNILDMNNIPYNEMKRIKNFFDNYKGTDKSFEYILNGGDAMKTWVNNTLNTATKAVHDFKQAKKDAGISNAFIKSHSKDRQNKKKNKPTQVKFNTKNVNRNMLNNTSLKYESKKHTIIISEQQEKILKEAADDQFSTQELSAIPSFKGKVDYCTKHLGQYIGKGSSRITFQIDDEKVLKLAFNGKGVAQNKEEDRAYGTIFPKIFESDDNGLWIISEFVLPCKAQDFKHCFGLSFKEFQSFISSCGKYRFGKKFWNYMPEEKWIELIENNEELAEFDDYIGNYGHIVCGDMERICNYGLTKRNGQPTIVLLDSGLTEDVYYTHYKKW